MARKRKGGILLLKILSKFFIINFLTISKYFYTFYIIYVIFNSGIQLQCCFFDAWASKFDKLHEQREKVGHVVMILQLAKVSYFGGKHPINYQICFNYISKKYRLSVFVYNSTDKPSVTNAMWGSKLYLNDDIPEINTFRQM